MLTKGFYYFLMIGEIAIVGLIMAGIYTKVKRIISMSAERTDDQKSEHYVSESDQAAAARHDIWPAGTSGLPSRAGEIKSGQASWTLNS